MCLCGQVIGESAGYVRQCCEENLSKRNYAFEQSIEMTRKVHVSDSIGVSKRELFESWRDDLGYYRAVLLCCNYPVLQVVQMTEEDAESEVQAISHDV